MVGCITGSIQIVSGINFLKFLTDTDIDFLKFLTGSVWGEFVELVAESNKTRPLFCELAPEMLREAVACLPFAAVRKMLPLSRSWRTLLSHDRQWERMCQMWWPGTTCGSIGSSTWRTFAMRGGGDMLGEKLLNKLKMIQDQAQQDLRCNAGHGLERSFVDAPGFFCDVCGEATLFLGSDIWSCRMCNYDRCGKCVSAMKAPDAEANGATNCSGKDGWTSLHYCGRLGFRKVAERLLDARADIDSTHHPSGYTPLMISATHGQAEMCAFLLTRGAAKGACTPFGRTALDCARIWGRKGLEPLLA
jgi:ribosomal protein L37AE/L43A